MKGYTLWALMLALGPQYNSLQAQVMSSGGVHVHHHDHVVTDRYGHIVGRHHHDVVHPNSTYVSTASTAGGGVYYVHNGQTYYYQRPAHGDFNHVAPSQVAFGAFSHVDELATRLEALMNDLCLDLHYNYYHNHDFRATYAEAYQILQTAKYIHEAEHANDRAAIADRLGGMDAEFHHIQDDVRGWSRIHRRQIGHLGILTKMEMIEATIHHLMNDVGVHGSAHGHDAPPPGGFGESAPPPQ